MSESSSEQNHESEPTSSPSIIVLGAASRDLETGETTVEMNTDSISDSSSQISNDIYHRDLENSTSSQLEERRNSHCISLESDEVHTFGVAVDDSNAGHAQEHTAATPASSNRDIPLASSLPARFAASPIDECLEARVMPLAKILSDRPENIQHADSLPTGLGNGSEGADSAADLPTIPKHQLPSLRIRAYDVPMSPSRVNETSRDDQNITDVNGSPDLSNIQHSSQSQAAERPDVPMPEGALSPSSYQEVSQTDQWSIEVEASPKKAILIESLHVPRPQRSVCGNVAIECTISPGDSERCETTSSDDVNQCDLESMPLLHPRQAGQAYSSATDESEDNAQAHQTDSGAANSSANRPLNYGRFRLPNRMRRRDRDDYAEIKILEHHIHRVWEVMWFSGAGGVGMFFINLIFYALRAKVASIVLSVIDGLLFVMYFAMFIYKKYLRQKRKELVRRIRSRQGRSGHRQR